ncbi:branched-chain amino acid ABC transporter permease [Mesoflavibacter zeaxanthinifaciens]|uniref:branched-chain amino acid ABC transporter permease n=1 Tax=Mesoflavibacter zeaxanthinifaciens TaxID=393060 RepID=UPI003A8CC16B
MDYLLHILVILNIYIILSVSSSLMIGLSNLLSLGQAAFYGVGAYITALALMHFGFSLIPAILLAIFCTVLLSIALSFVILKFEGDFFVLVTLGFQIIVYTILYNWISVTKGPYGIPGIPSPKIFGLWEINTTLGFAILSALFMLITLLVFYRLVYSPFGRALRAMRDDNIAFTAMGRNPAKYKIWTFVLSSSFAAVSGFIYASYISYIDPTSFNLDESIFIITAVLIGGTGNIKGPLLGAAFVVILPEALRFVGMPDAIAANLRMIIYGIFIVFLMIYRPQGIAGVTKI